MILYYVCEHPNNLECAYYAAGSASYKDVLKRGEESIEIPFTYKEAMISSQIQEGKITIKKEMNSLKQHLVFDNVLIKNVP